MFKTYEELKEAYPLGLIYKTEEVRQRLYCAHEVILDKMKEFYGEENVQMVSPHHAECKHLVLHVIDGYYTDGDAWYPMDGTTILTAADLEKGE